MFELLMMQLKPMIAAKVKVSFPLNSEKIFDIDDVKNSLAKVGLDFLDIEIKDGVLLIKRVS